ncbi:MAG: electron transport complex subunit RsxC [Ruminococcaceae bacterium]|nr:electron transport complex subunit RsxC [Oscillospiraceae bacterium]
MALTFKGGLHPEENKITAASPIEVMPEPGTVAIAMSQHIGAPCIPIVKKGDYVYKGQKIGEGQSGLTCPVHASVSGTVSGIEDRVGAFGQKVTHVIIENDFKSELHPDIKPNETPIEEASFEDIVNTIKEAGIAGLGGATFPTHFKISSAKGKVDGLIINCCECEPYITANHRLMLEKASDIINGIKLVMKALDINKCDIGIEDNKKDAIKVMREHTENEYGINIKVLKTKYPQGDERQLIYAIDKVQIPAGKLPADVGRVVLNAETTASIWKAYKYGIPLVDRIITVTGNCVANPKNLIVPLGTSVTDIINHCGGFTSEVEKIISGGPMMGTAQWDENAPVIKGTASILCFAKKKKASIAETCIHCGKCVGSCPMHLMPIYLASFAKLGDWESCRDFDVMSCVECGCCTYQCPGNVPIVQYIRTAKGKLKK